MADKLILTKPFLSLDPAAVDVSAEIESIELTPTIETPDTTTAGDAGVRTFAPGLKASTAVVNVIFNADLSTGLHTHLRTNEGTKQTLVMRSSTAAVSPSNPQATVSGILPMAPLGGPIGQPFKRSFTIQLSGAIVWATA